jgi:hypothetical protein
MFNAVNFWDNVEMIVGALDPSARQKSCGPGLGGRDEPLTAPHAPSRWRGEMHHAHNRGRVAEAVEARLKTARKIQYEDVA